MQQASPHAYLQSRFISSATGSRAATGTLVVCHPRSPLHRTLQAGMETGKSGLWNPHSPELSWKQQEVIFKKQHLLAVTWEISLSLSSPLWPTLLSAAAAFPSPAQRPWERMRATTCRRGGGSALKTTSGRSLGFPRRRFCACVPGIHTVTSV